VYILSLAWKNISNRKSSIAIVIFMSLAMSMLLIINAVFDGTETGIQKAFTRSFTGDFVIRPVTDMPLSLFGDETPVTGELSELPQVIPYLDCFNAMKKMDSIKGFAPQITGLAQLSFEDDKENVPLFGISGKNYMDLMSSNKIIEGQPFGGYEEGAMLSTALVKRIEKKSGKTIKIGDKIQLTIAENTTFRIRTVPITAIYEYAVENPILDRIVLVDHDTVRDLMGLKSTSVDVTKIDSENLDLLDVSIDDLFSDESDITITGNTETPVLAASSIIHTEKTVPIDTSIPAIESETLWNYIIGTVKSGEKANSVIHDLNKQFKQNDWPLEAINWRTAAGSTAVYLYWMRMIFNIGVIIILFTGFLVVNNTLIINVMDRTREIGTLQAIGAGKPFIVKLFLTETYILTMVSGVLGIILGTIGILILDFVKITFSNSYIIQLFGSTILSPQVTVSNIISILGLSVLLGFLGWIAPVQIALRDTPVTAMRGGRQ
jgi:ABC-type lipoprotein release transport system permease subunit